MKHFYLNVFFLISFCAAFAQAPAITYQTPKVYTINSAISPLAPTNTGGAVPATIYGQVSTFAGSGALGSANGTGTAASFNAPTRSVFDASGNLYVVDRDNNQIRKITPAGVVSNFASGGLSGPNGICIDATGNLYVTDASNNLIRKITSTGVITTFAGSGTPTLTDGQGTAANFHFPFGISTDASGNFIVADTYNYAIRKITPVGLVSTIAGTGAPGGANGLAAVATFNTPNYAQADALGNIYVSDPGNYVIRKISPLGVVTTFAGTGVAGATNGPAVSATFGATGGVAVDPTAGFIYVADLGNSLIRRIDPSGIVGTLAGSGIQGAVNGIGTAASFNRPNDVTYTPGILYVTDYGNNLIRKVITTGYTIDKPLPAGLSFDATTGIISGTPTTVTAAATYTITAYNVFGSSSFALSIGVTSIVPQIIIFLPIANVTYGSADITPGATSVTSLINPITYTSSNTAVATITAGNKIHIVGVGTVTITASEGGDPLLFSPATPVSQTFTVNPATVNITVGNQTKVYGAANPAATFTYTGFVNGETTSVLTALPTITTSIIATTPAGNYVLNAAGAVSPNYIFTYTTGILTITPAPLTITAVNATRLYGAPNPAFTATYAGFVAGDDATKLSTQASITTTATLTSPVGTYPINASAAVDGNYTITYVAGTLTVTPAPLTITANNATRLYGAANPAFTATYTGFVAGDDATKLTTQPTFATTATVSSTVGTYPITASGAADANYTISYAPGILTITAAPRTLTFNPIPTKGVNDADFDPGATVSTGDQVIYTSSDPYIAVIINNKVHILHAGTVTITATVASRPNYADVPSQSQLLSILADPADLVAIHPVVTPNGDGINDVLLIDAIANYPENNLTIVNINGTRVYESGGYDNVTNPFDGHSNITGSFLPQGTYYYSLRFKANGEFKKKIGFFVLKY